MTDIQGPVPDDPTAGAENDATSGAEPGGSAPQGRATRGPSRRRVLLPVVVLLAVVALAAAALTVRGVLKERDRANPAADGWAFEVRPVLAAGAPATTFTAPHPSASPTDPSDPAWITAQLASQAEAMDCAATPSVVAADRALVACAADGSQVYVLGPAGVTGSAITTVGTDAGLSSLLVELTPAGDTALTAMTGRAVALPSPRNQIALVLDGRVLRAPVVAEPSAGGPLQIAVDAPRAELEAMEARVSAPRH
ncbi:hypothetical protein [Cellulomonas citrea]|uniref:hypothetical protein n=1 Tax=Cellulomonas citrea TaxID=1909423 RepID=UPI001356BAE4|nr:hypothetical protein [Cellulomonas citrea]